MLCPFRTIGLDQAIRPANHYEVVASRQEAGAVLPDRRSSEGRSAAVSERRPLDRLRAGGNHTVRRDCTQLLDHLGQRGIRSVERHTELRSVDEHELVLSLDSLDSASPIDSLHDGTRRSLCAHRRLGNVCLEGRPAITFVIDEALALAIFDGLRAGWADRLRRRSLG